VEKIFTALGYIRLRGNINTNKIEHGIVYKEPDKNSEEKLKNYITKFLEYKNNPEKFIQDLLNANDNSVLYKRIKNMLINFSKM
jgi:DNA helicase-2/ATP-dependent DNA helicase PcrA